MKMGEEDTSDLDTWISKLGPGNIAGADPNLVGAGDWLDWEENLSKGEVVLIPINNIIDNVWTEEGGRPPNTPKDLIVHELEFSGEGWESKISKLREKLVEMEVF